MEFEGLRSPTKKTCCACKEEKLETDFYRVSKTSSERNSLCKSCSRKSVKKWQKENPVKVKSGCKRADLKRLYGLTQEQKDRLISEQKGKCPICENSIISNACVDHDHTSGKIRGILCKKCNFALGSLGDSYHNAQRAANYLKSSGSVSGIYIPARPNSTPMKLLVTGGSGLVGTALQTIAPAETLFLKSRKECDLLRWIDVERVFRTFRPTHVIHLAAKVGGVKANMASPADFFLENTTLNNHILEASRIFGVRKLVCFLSTCIFPDGLNKPMEPSMLHDGPPHDSNYGYAYAKRMLAVQCRTYNEQYGTNFVPVVPCNIYGPYDNFHRENSHVVPALILKFWEAKLKDQDVTLWGDGKPLREFIYSQDVADLCMKVLLEYDKQEPLILSTGHEDSIQTLAMTIATSMGFQGEIKFDTSKPSGQYRKPSNNLPLMEQWPTYQFTDLVAGIDKTVDWFKAVYPNVRGLTL